jgi:hypothetical protein
MDKWRVGDDTGSKETDRCPLTVVVECVMSWNTIITVITAISFFNDI